MLYYIHVPVLKLETSDKKLVAKSEDRHYFANFSFLASSTEHHLFWNGLVNVGNYRLLPVNEII